MSFGEDARKTITPMARPLSQPALSNTSLSPDTQAIIAAIEKQNALITSAINVDSTNVLKGFDSPVSIVFVDLTAANAAKQITIPPCSSIQAISDNGNMDGIYVALSRQDASPINLSKANSIPALNVNVIYLTSDVRQGRSKLTLYFSRTEPLGLTIGGEGITQAELAVRSGSISSFDRRGEIIWQDDFQGAFKWTQGQTSTGNWQGLTTTFPGGYLLKANTVGKLITGSSNNYASELRRVLSYPKTRRIGFEISPTFWGNVGGQYLLDLNAYDGVNSYEGALLIDEDNLVLRYLNSGGTFTTFGPSIIGSTGLHYHNLKVVIDIATKTYARLVFDGQDFEMTSIPLSVNASVSTPLLQLAYRASNPTAHTVFTSYVADAIVTINEP